MKRVPIERQVCLLKFLFCLLFFVLKKILTNNSNTNTHQKKKQFSHLCHTKTFFLTKKEIRMYMNMSGKEQLG